MSQATFKCPNCGAEITYDGGTAAAVQCHYCGQSVPVPDHLRPPQAPVIELNLGATLNQVQSAMRLAETAVPIPQRRSRSVGCIALFIIGLIAFIGLTTILPIYFAVQGSNIGNEASDAAHAIQTQVHAAEPTRRPATPITPPTPAATPTPSFAAVALQFGGQGMGPGQFTNAHLSGIDGEGHLYVGEYVGGRIQVFDAKGKFLRQFFVGGKKMDLLGFAADRKGLVYVADGGDITRYDGATGKALGKIAYSGGPGFGELALAPDGSLYAMWYQRRNGVFTSVEGAREDLVHFDDNGKVIKVIQGVISSMTDSVELNNSLVVDGRGNVYIAAEFESTIFKFDASGKFITRIGSSGEGASQFGDLGAIAVDGQGRLFVVESSKITVLKADGSVFDKIEVAGAARCLLFDDAGALWVTTDDGVVKYQFPVK
jgi:sugar lactone lactonase YvrE